MTSTFESPGNQSLGDATYEAKRDVYVSNSENLLARSLHPLAYQNNPGFRTLLERTGLPFRHYAARPQDALDAVLTVTKP